jgi:tripartite ATP-independent transporter DctM subunit
MAQYLIVIFAILLVSLFLGTPVSNAMGITAIGAILLFMGASHMIQFSAIAYRQLSTQNQLVAPMFILMAEFLANGDVATDLYYVINKALRKLKGGLALSTTLACTVFAALCGSSPATAASIGRISISQMTNRHYRGDFAAGTVAAGGTLGIMIPPSITFVTYGIITETSVSKLLMAGLIPGIMLSLLLCLSIVIRIRFNPTLIGEAPRAARGATAQPAVPAYTLQEAEEKRTTLLQDLGLAVPAFLLIFIVLGSLYTGFASTLESAGFGAIGAFLIVLFQRRLSWKMMIRIFKATTRTSTMILFLIICGYCLSYCVSYLGIASKLASIIVDSGLSRWVVMIMLFVLWFILGCLMDPGSMIVLTIPFVFTTLVELGFDPIWIGVVAVLCVEIGMITPPVGLNLFVLRSVTDVPMTQIIKGSLPYVLVLVIGLAILCVFPDLALWLPSRM